MMCQSRKVAPNQQMSKNNVQVALGSACLKFSRQHCGTTSGFRGLVLLLAVYNKLIPGQ